MKFTSHGISFSFLLFIMLVSLVQLSANAAYTALYRVSINSFTSASYITQNTQADISVCGEVVDALIGPDRGPSWLVPVLTEYTEVRASYGDGYSGYMDVFWAYEDGYEEYFLYLAYNDFPNFQTYWNLIEQYNDAINQVRESYFSAYSAEEQSIETFIEEQFLADPAIFSDVDRSINDCFARLHLNEWYSNGTYFYYTLGLNLYNIWSAEGAPYFALGSYFSMLADATGSQRENQVAAAIYLFSSQDQFSDLQAYQNATLAYYNPVEDLYDAYAGYYVATSLINEG